MARPRKKFDDLRIHQVNIRLTETEKEVAQKQSELAGLSIANWLRISAFSKRKLHITVSPMHRAYYRQLIGVSTNINQISRKINQDQYPKILQELIEVKRLLSEINKLFQK